MDSCAHHIEPAGNTEIIQVLLNTFDQDLTEITVLEMGYGTGYLVRRMLEAGVKKILAIEALRSAWYLKSMFDYDDRLSLYGVDVMELKLVRPECFSTVDAITCIIGVEEPTLEALRLFFDTDNIRNIVLLSPCSGFRQLVDTVIERWFEHDSAFDWNNIHVTAGRIPSVKLSGSGNLRHLWWLRKSKTMRARRSCSTRAAKNRMAQDVRDALASKKCEQ